MSSGGKSFCEVKNGNRIGGSSLFVLANAGSKDFLSRIVFLCSPPPALNIAPGGYRCAGQGMRLCMLGPSFRLSLDSALEIIGDHEPRFFTNLESRPSRSASLESKQEMKSLLFFFDRICITPKIVASKAPTTSFFPRQEQSLLEVFDSRLSILFIIKLFLCGSVPFVSERSQIDLDRLLSH